MARKLTSKGLETFASCILVRLAYYNKHSLRLELNGLVFARTAVVHHSGLIQSRGPGEVLVVMVIIN